MAQPLDADAVGSASTRGPGASPAASPEPVRAVRAPVQARSRESFARVQDAALALLRERGDDSFTLADVSARAGVSTGSIYGRITSKDALIRLVHEREMERIAASSTAALRSAAATAPDLPAAALALVSALADLLAEQAPVLRPFMLRAAYDDDVARRGRDSSLLERAAFCEGLLRHRDQVRRPDPEVAVQWCHTVVYSVLARRLGLGSTAEGAGDAELSQMVTDLASMVTSFLLAPAPA